MVILIIKENHGISAWVGVKTKVYGRIFLCSERMRWAMAIPIKPTPKLNKEESEKFLAKVDEGLKKPSGKISTPKLHAAEKRISQRYALKGAK